MKKLAILALVLILSGCASQQRPRTPDQVIDRALRGAPGRAQPSSLVATELAFARLAQVKGQWTAFAEFAADDGVMFVPELVNAKAWLKGRENPPQAVEWQPHKVWMSCDGSLGVTKGAWQRANGTQGYFTTVWQRQKDGEYRWVMDQGDILAKPLSEPEFIQTQVADCSKVDTPALTADDPSASVRVGRSGDATLQWRVEVMPDLARHLSVYIWNEGELQEALALDVAAPPPGE